jgi:PST family polysaccharide transporter
MVAASDVKERAISSLKWVMLGNIAPQLLSPALAVVLARLLTPRDYGVVGIGAVVISLMQMVQRAGLGQALIQREENIEEAANAAFMLNLGLGVALYICLWLGAPVIGHYFAEPRAIAVVRVAGLDLMISSLGVVPAALLARSFQFRKLFWIQLIPTLLPFAASIPLALSGARYWALVVGPLVGSTMNVGLLWFVGKWRPGLSMNWNLAKQLLRFGGLVLLECLLAWVMISFDRGVVGKVIGAEALGVYTLGFSLTQAVIATPLSMITSVVLPTFSRLQFDREALANAYARGTRMVAAFAIPAGVGLALLSNQVVQLFFGQKWAGLAAILAVLAFWSSLGYVCAWGDDAYKAIGRPDTVPWIYGLTVPVMVPTFILGARAGLFTFTLARTIVVLVLGALIHAWFATHLLRVPWTYLWSACRWPFVSTAVMAGGVVAMLHLLPWGPGNLSRGVCLFFTVGGGAFLYVGAFYCLDKPFLSSVYSLFRRVLARSN